MTIREIESKTGLSTTSVCKALRYPRSVRASTLKKIEEIYGRSINDVP